MTKILPLLNAVLVAIAGAALASNTFGIAGVQTSGNSVEFSNVVANDAGTVELNEYQGAQQSRLR